MKYPKVSKIGNYQLGKYMVVKLETRVTLSDIQFAIINLVSNDYKRFNDINKEEVWEEVINNKVNGDFYLDSDPCEAHLDIVGKSYELFPEFS